MRTMSLSSLKEYKRPEEIVHGKPYEISPRVVYVKPLYLYDPGLNEQKLHHYLTLFGDFLSKVIQEGGTKIFEG